MGDQVQGDRAVTVPPDADDVTTTTSVGPAGPTRRLTFKLPKLDDPRLHVASVLLTVQVLGQVSLGFGLSIAQILVALLTAAVLEIALTTRGTRVVAWPASALLTGNGVALILRVPGTEHGDWFSMNGWYVFAATSALAVLSKYVIRTDGRPLFNPSNFGLVVAFLILGSGRADPQDLWWGPMSPGLVLTYAVIVVGGVLITRRLGLLAVSAVFWGTFAALMAVLALAGHSMTARWSLSPVGGFEYWWTLVLSPEILVFLFFMITDPRTAARGRTGSLLYAAAVAGTSGVLVAFQSTEYATKIALLSGLVAVCAARPLLEHLAPAGTAPSLSAWLGEDRRRPTAVAAIAIIVVALSLAGSSAAPSAVAQVAEGERPQWDLGPEAQPDVTIADGLSELGGSFDEVDARRIATETVQAVLIADMAVEDGDADLAETVSTGTFREELLAAAATPSPGRTFDTAVVDVVRDPEDFQAVPRLSVEFDGTVDGQPWSASYHIAPGSGPARVERQVPEG